MKKLILSVLSMVLISGASYAATLSMGLSGSMINYDASGTETVKSSGTKNKKSESGNAGAASLFLEADTGMVTIGLDVIPYAATIGDYNNARTDTDTDDSADTAGNNTGDIKFSKHVTLYVEKPINDLLFVKVGLSRMTIETSDDNATGSQYGDEDSSGYMFGLGTKRDLAYGSFMKMEAQYAKYEGATFNGSADGDSVKNKIELDDFDTITLKVSIGKSF